MILLNCLVVALPGISLAVLQVSGASVPTLR